MVYGIVIHKVRGNFKASEKLNGFNVKGSEPSKTEGKRGTSELYSQFFCPEGNDSKREVRVQHLISVVNSEVHFRNSSRTSQGFQITETLAGTPAVATNTLPNKNNNSRATPANASDPNMSLARVLSFSSPRPKRQSLNSYPSNIMPSNATEEGVTRIPRGILFERAKILVWRQVLGCVYTLICEPDENLITASTWISTFIAVLSKHFSDPRISEKTSVFTEFFEDILKIVNTLLPCGVLCLYNGTMVNQLHKSIVERTDLL